MIQKDILKSLYFLQITILLFLSGCSKNSKIDEDKFIKIYTDIVVAQDTIKAPSYKFDSLKTVVFNRYGITSKDYNSTIDYYNQDPQRWEKFFDKVTAYVEKLKKQSTPAEKKNFPIEKKD
ncbi:MAG: DUF4296 domain-containing protein [Bacteroidetes bacterium]|nr:DUF4296 domain-containing protein [Bacteroidota bacterium]